MGRERFAKIFWDATPRSLFLGPPLPEGLGVWWPDFMLPSRPEALGFGIITGLNLQILRIRKDITNAIAGTELIPSEPYPMKTW